MIILLKAHRSLRPRPIRRPRLRLTSPHPDTRQITLPAGIRPRLQRTLHRIRALRAVEPRRARPRILIGGHQIPDLVQQRIAHAVGGRRAPGNLLQRLAQRRDGRRVLQVEVGHLHVAGALARAAGEVVDVVFEVAGLEGHEGDQGADFGGRGDLVGYHGLDEVGRGLAGGCAFGCDGGVGAAGGGGDDLGDLGGGGVARGAKEGFCGDDGGAGCEGGEDEEGGDYLGEHFERDVFLPLLIILWVVGVAVFGDSDGARLGKRLWKKKKAQRFCSPARDCF
ncbi:hypothetical protein ACMFMF_011959 [Clarireedia jacksonii]